MHIILDATQVELYSEKYTVLELDTFRIVDGPSDVTAYCVVESIPITEMNQIDSFRNLHNNLMSNYRKKDWNYCEQAIDHLVGKWNGELDSFYIDLLQRINKFKEQDPGDMWDGVLLKSA
jgi:hypothetical protein